MFSAPFSFVYAPRNDHVRPQILPTRPKCQVAALTANIEALIAAVKSGGTQNRGDKRGSHDFHVGSATARVARRTINATGVTRATSATSVVNAIQSVTPIKKTGL
eukprot:3197579-Prymnesium_polylepis.1